MSGFTLTALDHVRHAVETLKTERLALAQRHEETENERERLDDMTEWLRKLETVEGEMEQYAWWDMHEGDPA